MMPQCSSPPSAWWPATSASATTSRRASVSNCWACLTTRRPRWRRDQGRGLARVPERSEEHTSELQSLMRISYAVFCLQQKNNTTAFYYHVPFFLTIKYKTNHNPNTILQYNLQIYHNHFTFSCL